MKQILIYLKSGNKLVPINERLHNMLCVYKVFWPPDTTLKLGKKTLVMKEFTPWPPPEQALLLEVAPEKPKKKNENYS